jgi:hypothetical protein
VDENPETLACSTCLPDMPGWVLSGGNEWKLPDGRFVWHCPDCRQWQQPWGASTQENPDSLRSPLKLACPHVWPAATVCRAWGAPSSHGCKLDPSHDGIHVCPCGRRDDG